MFRHKKKNWTWYPGTNMGEEVGKYDDEKMTRRGGGLEKRA